MSKKIMMYLMVVVVFASIFYQGYKRTKLDDASVVHVAVSYPIKTMDPILAEDTGSTRATCQVFEGLYEYSFYKKPHEIIPNIASAFPEVSKDRLTYTFELQSDVLFHDDPCFPDGKGREVRASDVVFTLKRLVDPAHGAPYADLILGKIEGLDAWREHANYSQEITGLKVLDKYILQVKLVKPWPDFLSFLARWPTFIVPEEAILRYGPDFGRHLVGTGPFVLKGNFDPQAKRLEFLRFVGYRKKVFPFDLAPPDQHMLPYSGHPVPLIDKVVMHIMPEEQPRWLQLQKGGVYIGRIDGTSIALSVIKNGELLPEFVEKGLVLSTAPGTITEFFVFNHNHELFRENLALRQAMSMAFDRATYNELFYNQTADEAQSIVPPLLLAGIAKAKNPYAYDLERAKEYLAKAGFPEGKGLPVITLDTKSETTQKNQAAFFAKCMGKIGIKIQVVTNVWPELINKVTKKQSTMMHTMSWSADCPDPSDFLQVISRKNAVGLQYFDHEFNALLEYAMQLPHKDPIKEKLYGQLNQMVAEKVPLICCVHRQSQFLHHKWLKNFKHNEFNCAPEVYMAVDLKEKKRMGK